MPDRQPLDRRGAFLADRLALAARQRTEEIVEARIAVVAPVELRSLAHQPPRRLEQRHLLGRHERRMRRRQVMLVRHRFQCRDQRRRRGGIAQQQPRPRHGTERRRDLQLGVIAPARTLPRIGPGMVEDIFALAVALGIGRRDRDRAAIGPVDDDRDRLPSRSPADAARRLERGKEGVADERVDAPGARIPLGSGDCGDAIGKTGSDGGHSPFKIGRARPGSTLSPTPPPTPAPPHRSPPRRRAAAPARRPRCAHGARRRRTARPSVPTRRSRPWAGR